MTEYLRGRLQQIAYMYDGMDNEPDVVRHHYTCFKHEISQQFDSIPIPVEFVSFDPYKGSNDMFIHLNIDKRLLVFTGGSEHPLLTPKQNWMFRAVHDYFAHYIPRNSFGPLGEFHAWQKHNEMMSLNGSRVALVLETLCQNAWYNFGPRSKETPRPFAEQKVGRIPTVTWIDLVTYREV